MIQPKPAAWLLLGLLFLVVYPFSTVYAQGESWSEPFDDPALPGWEHSPDVSVTEGELLLPPGSYVFRTGAWEDFNLNLSAKIQPDGMLVTSLRTTETGQYALRSGDGSLAFLRRSGRDERELKTVAFTPPETEWVEYQVTLAAGRFSVSGNGETLLNTNDDAPLPAGGILLANEGTRDVRIAEISLITKDNLPEGVEAAPPASAANENQPTGPQWQRSGGPPGGQGINIRYHFENPDTWYISDANTGFFISNDNGVTWQPANNGIFPQQDEGVFPHAGGLCVDPRNSQIIWGGLTDSAQIYKSDDGGANWQKAGAPLQSQDGSPIPTAFTIDPLNSDDIYALTRLTFPNARDRGALYLSTDAGNTWDLLAGSETFSGPLQQLWVDPRNHDILFVSISAETQNPILKSVDGGKDWQPAAEGLAGLNVYDLVMNTHTPDVLLAASGGSNTALAGGIHYTSDGGASWRKTYTTDDSGYFETIRTLEICPSDSSIAYAASENTVYASQDGGLTWKPASGGVDGWGPPGAYAGTPVDIQCDPRQAGRLFILSANGGAYLSEDGGQNWVHAGNGYSGASINSLSTDPTAAGRIYAAANSGIWRSDNGGLDWQGLRNLPAGANDPTPSIAWALVAADPLHSEHLLAVNATGQLFESQDTGNHWEFRFPIDPESRASVGRLCPVGMRFSLASPAKVIVAYGTCRSDLPVENPAGQRGLLAVSGDGGATWQAGQLQLGITHLALSEDDPNLVYAAAANGLYRSTDGGVTFEMLSGLTQGVAVTAVSAAPQNPQLLLAGVQAAGLYISRDGGTFWHAAGDYNSLGSPSEIIFDPTRPGTIYAADLAGGVFSSQDNGQTWHSLAAGLEKHPVAALTLSRDGAQLYAGSLDSGVYRLDLGGIAPAEAPPQAAENQPTPTAQTQPSPTAALSTPTAAPPPDLLPSLPQIPPVYLAGSTLEGRTLLLAGAGIVALLLLLLLIIRLFRKRRYK